MHPSSILSLLLQSVNFNNSFTQTAKYLASFAKKTEERFSVPEVLGAILRECSDLRQLEYLLFSFLDICRADFDMLEMAQSLRQIRRLVYIHKYYIMNITPCEQDLLSTLFSKTDIRSVNDVVAASRKTASLTMQLSQHEHISKDDRTFLATILTTEARILRIRSDRLIEHVDSYDMMAIARLMPLLTVCDEQISILMDIAKRIKHNGLLGRAILTFEYSMRAESFEKWKKNAGKDPSLKHFCSLIEMQRSRLVPVKQLVAVATLSRRLHTPDTNPLVWISHALSCCTAAGFRMDIGTSIDSVRSLLKRYNIVPKGSIISSSFTSGAYLQWINHDMLTKRESDEISQPSPMELVKQCINKDAILLRLLDNPKVIGVPGLVAKIALNSRSLSVLQKIAITRELYTGQANSGVPLALLKNPTHIPMSQIRQFISTQYVSLVEMKELLHNKFTIRRDVYSEVNSFISRRYY